MSRWLVRWRLALRIARRDALRHRGRTALVLMMVGLPILAVVGAGTLYRTWDVTPEEALPWSLGAADARIVGASREQVYADPVSGEQYETGTEPADPPWTRTEVRAALPSAAEVLETVSGNLTYRTEAGYARVQGYAQDLSDPVLEGTVDLVEGRFPTRDGEVVVSRALVARGVDVGDEIALTRDDVPARVVGVVRTGADLGANFVVLRPEWAGLLTGTRSTFFATVPGGLDWGAVQELNAQGLVVVSRKVADAPPSTAESLPPGGSGYLYAASSQDSAVLALGVAAVLLEVVLLAGPAFAVGVRRQRRDLALLAATGGAPRDLRRVVLAGGVVLGGGAALLGAALGVALVRVAVGPLERWAGVPMGPFDVPVGEAFVAVGVGVVAGLAAAYVPARQAARTHVIDALAGRRGQVHTSWRSPVVGLVLAAAGMVITVLGARGATLGVAAGAVLLVAGAVVATPWMVGLFAPLGRRLPLAGRLAVRDATRNRSRTAPAVAAVMATVAAVSALIVASASASANSRKDYVSQTAPGTAVVRGNLDQRSWTDLEALLEAQVSGREVSALRHVRRSASTPVGLQIQRAGCEGPIDDCMWLPEKTMTAHPTVDDMIVATPETAEALFPGSRGAEVGELLRSGRVAILGNDDGALDAAGQVRIAAVEYGDAESTLVGAVVLPGGQVAIPRLRPGSVPAIVVVPAALAERLPLPLETAVLVTGGPADPVSADQERQISETAAQLSDSMEVDVERGWQDDLAAARLVLFGLGGFLVLVATLSATGLALTDARPDFATLAAIGAAPRTRRFMAMGTAAVVGGGGALLGVLVGIVPGAAVAYPMLGDAGSGPSEPVIEIPWLLLGALPLLVPLLAVTVTGLAVRSKLPMSQRMA